jgi:hypothetical protein
MKRIALVIGCLVAAHTASAGIYIEMATHNLTTNSTDVDQKMYVQNGSGRFVDKEGHVSLIKGDAMYIIDDNEKSYIAMDKATMEKVAKQIGDTIAQAKEQIAKLPPEQRAQAEQMMGGVNMGGGEHKVEVADTGKSDNVEGRKCKVWDVTRNGELDEQICVVPFNALPGKEDLTTVFANFAKIYEEMAKSIPMLAGAMSNEFTARVKAGGFPFRSRAYENGKLIDEETLVKVWREEAVPASMFEIPAGYKQKQLSMGLH